MKPLVLSEVFSNNWNIGVTLDHKIDRSGKTVRSYLNDLNVIWQSQASEESIKIYKASAGGYGAKSMLRSILDYKHRYGEKYIYMLGEPREYCADYLLASKSNTLAVAPGRKFRRLYFATEWYDPKLDNWNKRFDKFCWIGKPTEERIKIAREIGRLGIELDIFSKDAWPLPNWRGYTDNEYLTSVQYKYRIACENYSTYLYHSDKLISSIRSGCVTFYLGDTRTDLSFIGNAFSRLDLDTLTHYREISPALIEGINKFLYTDAWEVYSFKHFYNRIIDLAREIAD